MKDILHIYTRVSTAVQEQGTSLDYQKELGQKCAAGHHISTTQRYIDVNSDQLSQAVELL